MGSRYSQGLLWRRILRLISIAPLLIFMLIALPQIIYHGESLFRREHVYAGKSPETTLGLLFFTSVHDDRVNPSSMPVV